MPIYAGIDEAGYGPLLGPLCVACCIFDYDELDAADDRAEPMACSPAASARGSAVAPAAPDLWKRLSPCVCRKPGDRRRRIAVDDSKKLKLSNDGIDDPLRHPLRHLERAVLAFAALSAELPACDDDLFRALGVPWACDPRSPWLDGPQPLPVAHQCDELRVAAASLRRGLAKAGVRSVKLVCRAVDAAEFNRQYDLVQNKAGINFCTAMSLADAVFRAHREAMLVVDRQGGRTHYREELQMCFPEARITVVCEGEARSEYELCEGDRRLIIRFEMESETRNLPTALASMTAKYVRELAMGRLNRFFRGHLPELKPTAGYYGDGRRFINDVEHVVARLGLEPSRLIRRA